MYMYYVAYPSVLLCYLLCYKVDLKDFCSLLFMLSVVMMKCQVGNKKMPSIRIKNSLTLNGSFNCSPFIFTQHRN